MERWILVGLGGLIGTLARYATGGWIARMKGGGTFPIETLVINVVGCFVIGFLAGLSETRGAFGPTARGFLFVGLLGGFTTYSAFGYETFRLLRDGQPTMAFGSVLLQVLLGLIGVWAGSVAARLMTPA